MAFKQHVKSISIPDGSGNPDVYEIEDGTLEAGDNITITQDGTTGKRYINAAGGSGIQTISDQYDIYIWDLNPGIYLLNAPYSADNQYKYIHYYGKNTSTSYRIAVGRGMGNVLLFVTCSRPGTISDATPTFKTWYVVYMAANQTTASSPIMYWGYTSASSGAAKYANMDSIVRGSSGTTTTTANKLLLSTTSAGMISYSNWSTAGVLTTNTSGVVSVDSNIVPVVANPSSTSGTLSSISINGTGYSVGGTTLYRYSGVKFGGNYSVSIGGSSRTVTLYASFIANAQYINMSSSKYLRLNFDPTLVTDPTITCIGDSSVHISNVKLYLAFSVNNDYYRINNFDWFAQYTDEEESDWTEYYLRFVDPYKSTFGIVSLYLGYTDYIDVPIKGGTLSGTSIM